MSKAPDRKTPHRRRRKDAANPAPPREPAFERAEPLAFLVDRPPARLEPVEDDSRLNWLAYDPEERAEWPDLGPHGYSLMLVVLPTGTVVDAMRQTGETDGNPLELGFDRHNSGLWVRRHRPVHMDDFRRVFPRAVAANLPLGRIVRVPSRENPDFLADFHAKRRLQEQERKDRRIAGPKVTDGRLIAESADRFKAQKFEHVGEVVDGLGWVEIGTLEQAKYAAELVGAPVHGFFATDNAKNDPPHRWFMLVTAARGVFEGKVVVAMGGMILDRPGEVTAIGPFHAFGVAGADPHPDWAPEIEKLCEVLDGPRDEPAAPSLR